ncbi:hypothetical protein [Prevotella fusca]|uniref:Uncharacterized protein n=1 Tax=Prevotella fusca JCM 17724 TaxID=1236517 RepID=A0A0K1NN11_9BACT|nr:hypothetical protein [Prevotella fusca]AKU70435.1 hypothetical protein ADJ77_11780 [Prevotella fusca JCM 17724]
MFYYRAAGLCNKGVAGYGKLKWTDTIPTRKQKMSGNSTINKDNEPIVVNLESGIEFPHDSKRLRYPTE